VETIALITKIPPRHVEALERGDALPLPSFYQRAEVRAVARVVGVDEQLAVERLEAERPPVAPPRRQPPPPEPSGFRTELVLAMVGTGFVAAWMAGWVPFDRTAASRGAIATQVQAPQLVTAPPAAPPPASEIPNPPEVPRPPTSGPVAAPHAPPIAAAASSVAPASVAVATPGYPTELVIRTEPEGARVTVNGIGWGESPITIQHLEPGEQHIRVTLDGFVATERSVVIDEGHQQAVNIGLNPQ